MLRAIGLGSGSGTNLAYLIENSVNCEFVALACDRDCPIIELAKDHKIPIINPQYPSLKDQNGKRLHSDLRNQLCREWEENLLKEIEAFQPVDVLILGGYSRILHQPLLRAFPTNTLNVHPGDLSHRNKLQERLLKGLDAVLKALILGLASTRSTIHYVSAGVDEGEIVLISQELEFQKRETIQEALKHFQVPEPELVSYEELERHIKERKKQAPELYRQLKNYCQEHQALQKKECDWPSYLKVVNSMAQGEIRWATEVHSDGRRVLLYQGKPMSYGGIQ